MAYLKQEVLDTLADTPLVILWGHNPNETILVTPITIFKKNEK